MNELVPFTDIERMATAMGKTGMFGKSPEQLLPLMLIAQAEGLHPAIAAQEYDIIQGRPAINSRSALARFQHAGGSIRWDKRTDSECEATFSHPQGGELKVHWDMKRAAQAGINGKDTWKKYPAQMLAARVIAEGVRAVYPACLSHLYTVEEVQDMAPDRTVEKPAEKTAEQPNEKPAPEPLFAETPIQPEKLEWYRQEFKSLIESGLLSDRGIGALQKALDSNLADPDKLEALYEKAKKAHDERKAS